jgi:intraflagellar transport protein 122
MWDHATKMAGETSKNVNEILIKKAQIQQDKNDLLAAATTYIEVGDYMQAANIFGQNKWFDRLVELARILNKLEIKVLNRCADFFKKSGLFEHAAEVYEKLGDAKGLMTMYIELQRWDDAFRLAEMYDDLRQDIYLPYANWLALNERFVEAQQNYRKAGRMDLALKVMNQLLDNAIAEHRYNDASYYCHVLSNEFIEVLPNRGTELSGEQAAALEQFKKFQDLADLYYAYHPVYRFVEEPFTSHLPESIFHMARFLLWRALKSPKSWPTSGISLSYVLFALVRLSKGLKTFKFGQFVTNRLLHHERLRTSWRPVVEANTMYFKGQAHTDAEELSPLCWQCGSVNPLWTQTNDTFSTKNELRPTCVYCTAAFTVSTYSFENLALIEFTPGDGISEEEALKLIHDQSSKLSKRPENLSSNQVDRLDLQKDSMDMSALASAIHGETRYRSGVSEFNRDALLELDASETFIVRFGKAGVPSRFFKAAISGSSLVMCQYCFRFFHAEDWEFVILQHGACPFCRMKVERDSLTGP